MALVKTWARDAEIIFTPESTENERAAAVNELMERIHMGDLPAAIASVAVYDDMQSQNYAAAGQTALALVAASVAGLFVVHALQRRPVAP